MKILLLFSGGLDSILAHKILLENNFKIKTVQFFTPFLGIKDIDNYKNYFAEKFNINIHIIDIWDEYKFIITNPVHGFGKNLNPCLDCKLLFYKKAASIMRHQGFYCIATGEVVGQRPFSQQQNTLAFLEKNSGLTGKILRPLSYGSSLKIQGKSFYNITGRGRKKQFELAKLFNITENITPAGGCLLTDPNFSKKCRIILDFFENSAENLEKEFFEIIKYGRVVTFDNSVIIIGKDEKDNEKLLKYKKFIDQKSVYLISENYPAPVSVILKKEPFELKLTEIEQIIKKYVKPSYRDVVKFKIVDNLE